MSEIQTEQNVQPEHTESPFVLGRAVVQRVEVLSPSFVRIEFGGDELRGLGTPGQSFDQRIKLIFPSSTGQLPDLSESGDDWYQDWLAIPESKRGSMRTYSIRDLTVTVDGSTRLVVDFVLHLVPGLTGPASTWAAAAKPGDEILILGPKRGKLEGVGIEYQPGAASTVLLAGDETAAPAIARIIEDLAEDAAQAPRVRAFIEVPEAQDALDIDVLDTAAFDRADVTWLPRQGAGTGSKLIPAVLEHLGARSDGELDSQADVGPDDDFGEELVWETPQFSRLGEQTTVGENHAESYFWIAGESKTVTTLRRHLVRDLGISRAQVAFMGYWRHGVAMKG